MHLLANGRRQEGPENTWVYSFRSCGAFDGFSNEGGRGCRTCNDRDASGVLRDLLSPVSGLCVPGLPAQRLLLCHPASTVPLPARTALSFASCRPSLSPLAVTPVVLTSLLTAGFAISFIARGYEFHQAGSGSLLSCLPLPCLVLRLGESDSAVSGFIVVCRFCACSEVKVCGNPALRKSASVFPKHLLTWCACVAVWWFSKYFRLLPCCYVDDGDL